MLFRKICSGALLVTFLAACGGGSGNQNSSSSAEASSSPGAMMASGAMQSIESRPQAPIPSSLSCGAVQPVWTNPARHTYFEPTSPMYGRTKQGSYMCPSAAVAAGFHKASGRKRHRGEGGMEGAAPSPAAT